jgi:cytoskeletal protein CcmA (bactofilin family)
VAELSTIGRGTTVRGNIRGDGDLDVHGRVEGSIAVKGDLSIAETALIRSDVSGKRVVVRGAIAGNVSADESLVLEAGARVVGDLAAPKIGIRPGALLRGNVSTNGMTVPRVAAVSAQKHEPARAPAAARAPVRPAAPPARPAPPPLKAPAPAPAPAPPPAQPAAAKAANARPTNGEKRHNAPPPPVVPSIGKGQKATLKRKGAR